MSPLRKNKIKGSPRKTPVGTKRQAQIALNEELRQRVWELKIRGHSFPAIARAIGYSNGRAREIYYEALEIHRQLTKETVEEGLVAELAYLNRLQVINEARLQDARDPVTQKLKKALPRAVADAVRIMDRRARYLGLDAPERRELSGPKGGPIPSEVKFSFDDIDAALAAGDANLGNASAYTNGTYAPHESPVSSPEVDPTTRQ